MNLTFEKDGSLYEATFNATAAFNLHIERPVGGLLEIKQRTPSAGQFALIDDLRFAEGKVVLDLDFTGGIFPKDIKVVSASKPSMAFVTFGE